jgi:hypothetical protein
MHEGRIIFSQLMDFLPKHEFDKCVQRYDGNRKVRSFSCFDQFLCMAYAQLTRQEGLRGIEAGLRAIGPKLYHMGIRGNVSRSTLADANETRDWRIFADFAQVLIAMARRLYADEPFGVRLKQTVYALDSTTIDLCLALFPWAQFRRHKAAVKLHTLLDVRGSIPSVIIITSGKVHDVNILDELSIEPGAIYVMDRGYLDFARLHRIDQDRAFFLTRAKSNFQFRRLRSHPVNKSRGVQCDQTIVLKGHAVRKDYPGALRRIRYLDPEDGKRFVFLTNHFKLSAITIAQLYRSRWKVELFFKWIKQHLRIKAFYGTSDNAVRSQVWIAIAVYVLVAIMKKELGLEHRLYTILQILDAVITENMPILQAFSMQEHTIQEDERYIQLSLFDF